MNISEPCPLPCLFIDVDDIACQEDLLEKGRLIQDLKNGDHQIRKGKNILSNSTEQVTFLRCKR